MLANVDLIAVFNFKISLTHTIAINEPMNLFKAAHIDFEIY